MRLLIGALLSLVVAAAIGLGATWLTLTRGVAFGAVTLGAWTAYPRAGSADIDPYARAAVSRGGLLPLGLGDGVAFLARTDDAGRALDGRCDVRVAGTTPQARYFTLTLYRPDGALVANSLGRYGFTSQELVRQSDGSFEIVLAPRARPGNWLPTGGVERYILLLRLYDTPVGIATRAEREAPMPAITAAETCS
ncbi:DUF1214 domain-containing protein [Rhodoplanes serenus]|uniref:DUF1214 domain-containing protein n=1 Tax=Rhodoplanes serenus TaxID=200615 RepID=A0A3S4BXJ0_9BRAD|nr:DUF1214 domain-containing protein [Rhodoplanes serenus]MTW17113.1 DUF1214 domain-containing protein [Rhodoplanes serenus]VCU09956.1 hypothetical protein RHODGE_RHODGE_03612 [Rhodoplanes serenus]